MTSRVSGWTEGVLEARAKCIAASIHRVARGEPLLNLSPVLLTSPPEELRRFSGPRMI